MLFKINISIPKSFISLVNTNQRIGSSIDFCCHKCYIRDRFWRKEDLVEVTKCLEKGIPVSNAPGWIRDLVIGGKDRKIGDF